MNDPDIMEFTFLALGSMLQPDRVALDPELKHVVGLIKLSWDPDPSRIRRAGWIAPGQEEVLAYGNSVEERTAGRIWLRVRGCCRVDRTDGRSYERRRSLSELPSVRWRDSTQGHLRRLHRCAVPSGLDRSVDLVASPGDGPCSLRQHNASPESARGSMR